MQTMKGTSDVVKICYQDKLTLEHLIHVLEKEFNVQLFDVSEKGAEDILIVSKKK